MQGPGFFVLFDADNTKGQTFDCKLFDKQLFTKDLWREMQICFAGGSSKPLKNKSYQARLVREDNLILEVVIAAVYNDLI